MAIRSPFRLAVLLLGPLALAACDGGAAGDGPPANDGRITAAAPADATLELERDSLVVDLTAVFRHADGAALAFTAATRTGPDAPVVLAQRGPAVVVRPSQAGSAEVMLTATAGGSRAYTSFTVTTTVADRIWVSSGLSMVEAVEGVPVAGPPVSALFRHLDGRPLAFTVATSAPSKVRAEIVADSIRLTPSEPGSAVVTVTASDRGYTKTVSFSVNVLPYAAVACPAPAVGQSNFLPVRDGDVWRFAYASEDVGGFGAIRTTVSASAVWALRDRGCRDGLHRFDVAETLTGTQTRTTPSDTTRTPVSQTRTFVLTFNATSLTFEAYPLYNNPEPVPVPYVASADAQVQFIFSRYLGFGSYYGSAVHLSRTRGLEYLSAGSRSTHTGNEGISWSLRRTG